MLYETNNEGLEVKQKDVCLAILVATAGIHKWNCKLSLHADLKGSDIDCAHCSKCGCAICARSGYQREERRGAWVEATSDKRHRIWGGGQGTKAG